MVSADFGDFENMNNIVEALEKLKGMRVDIEWTIFLLENYLGHIQQHV
jgi:hypothetical protein